MQFQLFWAIFHESRSNNLEQDEPSRKPGLMGSSRPGGWERGVALTSSVHRFETRHGGLAREVPPRGMRGLATLNRELVARAEGVGSSQQVVLDMDSSQSPVYGEQEQNVYNGYFNETVPWSVLRFASGCKHLF